MSSDRLSNLKGALLAIEKMRAKVAALEKQQTEPIAIIGIGCRFPAGADCPDAFWRLLRNGVDAIREVPAERWDVDAFYDPNPEAPGKMYTRSGGFLDDIDLFDPEFFGISAREAVSMDPQQRLLLEVSWEALEHAGCAADRLVGSRTGVFVGICNREYGDTIGEAFDPAAIDAYTGTGKAFSVAAGRISHALGFNGPNLAVDTACSSSLVALHLACQSLRLGECSMALAGGVNLVLSPFGSVYLSRARAVAPDGRCHTFDESASGYGRGEGCGVLVLKPLSDARAKGDRVIAVIRGSAVNHDGRSSGLTVPNGTAQQALIRQALKNARIDASDVQYVEAHGTGTALGDPIEVGAMASVYCRDRSADEPLLMGSLKTNIGHLEAAAGVAGVIKVALSLSHAEIPPHLHLRKLNPRIAESDAPVRVPVEPTPWPTGSQPRCAALSSFGLSGTNVHVILSEPQPMEPVDRAAERPVHLLAISARSDTALRKLAVAYADHLRSHPEVPFADVCFTANTGRAAFPCRLAVAATSADEAEARLRAFASADNLSGVYHGEGRDASSLAMVFGADDGPYFRARRELDETHEVFRESIDRCAELLARHLDEPLRDILFPAGVEPDLLEDAGCRYATRVAFGYALAELWRSWGIEPELVIGQSIGEYAAAIVAGALELEDGLALAVAHGRMLEARRKDQRLSAVQGAGSQAANTAVEAFTVALGEVEVRAPRIPIVSLTLGERVEPQSIPDMDRWFSLSGSAAGEDGEIQSIASADCGVYLEINPLHNRAQSAAEGRITRWLPGRSDADGYWPTLIESLGWLLAEGCRVDWAAFDRPYPRMKVALPTYPFERQRYSIDAATRRDSRPGLVVGARRMSDPLLGNWLRSPIREFLFEARYSVPLLPLLFDHRFYDSVIVASATYLSMLVAGIREAFRQDRVVINDVAFPQPLILEGNGVHVVDLVLTPEGPERASFRILSTAEAELEAEESPTWRLHAAGTAQYGAVPDEPRTGEPLSLSAIRSQDWDPLDAEQYYATGLEAGMQAGPSFKWISRLWRQDGAALGEMIEPKDMLPDGSAFAIHPGLVDSCFQLLAACLPDEYFPPPEGEIPVVVKIERFEQLARSLEKPLWTYIRLRSIDTATSRFTSDFQLYDGRGELLFDVSGLCVQLVRHGELVRRNRDQLKDLLYTVEWQPAASAGDRMAASAERGDWLIFSDHTGIAAQLIATLESRGQRCIEVRPGNGFAVDDTGYGVNPAVADDYRSLFGTLADARRPLAGVVNLWSVDVGCADALTGEALERSRCLSTSSALLMIQALLQTHWRDPPAIWLVTQGVHGEDGLGQAPLWGLGRVVATEHPELECRCVDMNAAGGADQGGLLCDEILHPDREDQVSYRGGVRSVPRLLRAKQSSLRDPNVLSGGPDQPLRADATYLITGGLGSLGLLVAGWMVARGARHLVLVGRTPPDDARAAELERLERAGAHVWVAIADVARRDRLQAVIEDIDPSFPLTGVVHAAGVLDDAPLLQQETDRFDAVMAPKVSGAWHLHDLTRTMNLDFFVMFSSVAAILGSPGQAAYAAASAFLDALAHHRERQHLPALSIDWGPWSSAGGMADRTGDSGERHWREIGFEKIGTEQGLEVLDRLLYAGSTQTAVLRVDWAKFHELYRAGSEPPMLSALLGPPKRTVPNPAQAEMRKRIRQATPDQRLALLMEHVRVETTKVLGLSPSHALDPTVELSELGLDSLMAIELRNALQESLGCSLPATLLYEKPILAEVVDYLAKEPINANP